MLDATAFSSFFLTESHLVVALPETLTEGCKKVKQEGFRQMDHKEPE